MCPTELDYRLGPPRYARGTPWEGKPLKLSEDTRRCVVFLGWQGAGPSDTAPIEPKGTGFLLVDDREKPQKVYLVTAKHVAKVLQPPFVIRVNKRDEGAGLIHIEKPSDIDWCFHGDPTVDLAVAPISLPSWAYAKGVRVGGLAKNLEELKAIDAGNIVCVLGLFHLLRGDKKNLPVTHVGHVAMLPQDELIPVDGVMREGYLVQANAVSGCSGSPVFTSRQLGFGPVLGTARNAILLGVWSASWKVKGSEIVACKSDDDDERGNCAPLGMGVVTPLSKLVDILASTELKVAVAKLWAKILDSLSATADIAIRDDASNTPDDNPQQKEDFTALLNAAMRKPEPSDKT